MHEPAPDNLRPAAPELPLNSSTGSETSTRLHGRWLLLVRMAWLVLVLSAVAPFVAGVPARIAQLSTVAPEVRLSLLRVLAPQDVAALSDLGLSLRFYARYIIVFELVPALACAFVAAVIVSRKSNDWMALLVALTLVKLGTTASPVAYAAVEVHPVWRLAVTLSTGIGQACFIMLLFLFPDGRFVPRWTLVLAVICSAWIVSATHLYFYGNVDIWPLRWQIPMSVGWYGGTIVGVYAQIYRYRRVSDPVQRQQSKWVVFGLVAVILGFAVNGVFFVLLHEPGPLRLGYHMVGTPLFLFTLTILPLSTGMAILRYRLWDIDILINRSLVYGTLTAILGLVYFGSVVLLQQLLRVLTGQGDQLAIVASTLAIAALFQPLRLRLQATIDRRFYRRKYDAVRTLQAFGVRMRDEVDLQQVSADLLEVVEETMQPAHVSLWLRPARRPRQTES